MSKKVFLLGAGFSKLAGLPLAKELINFIFQYLRNSRNVSDIEDYYPEISGFLEKCKEKYPWILEDIELLFTYLDFALLSNSKEIFKDFNYDLRILRKKLSGVLVRAFRDAHYDFSIRKGEVTKEQIEADQIYWKFCKNLSKDDTVITFNYDLIVEKGLWLQNKWTFLDGYGFNKNIEDFEDDFKKYPYEKPKNSLVKVYKLHGSLGWIYDESNEQIILGEMSDYFSDYTGFYCERDLYTETARWDEGTTFIEPSYIKLFDRPIILDIWKKAFEEIQQSDELIIIGYSLPALDSAARILLSTAVRNSQISSITVVNPPTESFVLMSVFDKFDGLFGKKVIRKRMSFKEWVKNEI